MFAISKYIFVANLCPCDDIINNKELGDKCLRS